MPANIDPIYTKSPNVQATRLSGTIGLSRSDGVAANAIGSAGVAAHFLAFTPGSNGSYVRSCLVKAVANTPTTTGATVVRLFLSSINTGTPTADNTHCIREIAVPAVSADSATLPTPDYEIPINFAIASGQYILASTHANLSTNCEMKLTMIGADY